MTTFATRDATRIPIATYRLQLNKDFNFKQACGITSYLKRLGISDCYSSPILKARRGSTHCYDVTDHEQINPELGSLREFNRWVARLHSNDIGLVLDIVPNHMAVSDENLLLLDVLEYGPFSRYSGFFDIDWNPSYALGLRNRVILPILGTTISKALANRHISLTFSKGEFGLRIYSMKLPLTPKSYTRILNYAKRKLKVSGFSQENVLKELDKIVRDFAKLPDLLSSNPKEENYPFSFATKKKRDLARLCLAYSDVEGAINQVLDEFHNNMRGDNYSEIRHLLHGQFYKLEFWKNAINKVNYRRFATVNNLIAICEERPAVFKEAHALILNLVASQKIDGLRVDHIDGLYKPSDYLARLQKSCQRKLSISKKGNAPKSPSSTKADNQKTFYVIVEKILAEGENIPKSWRTYGTTGYEFLCDLNGIFIDLSNSSKFDHIYSNFVPRQKTFERTVESCRRNIIDSSMNSELSDLTNLLSDIVKDLHTKNYTSKEDMRAAIREVAVCFPIYRTYSSSQVSVADRRYMDQSIHFAMFHLGKKDIRGRYRRIVDDIRRILLFDFPRNIPRYQRMKWRLFVMRFQQLTAPIAAKGIEDTAFYIYNRLISLNEVGGNPENFGISIEEFHKRSLRRFASHPHTLLASSTHDTKRSEDVRAKINVLSEIPDQWNKTVLSWSNFNRNKKSIVNKEPCPSKNDEYMLYQTILGVWPLERVNKIEREELIQRILSYMKKAIREAKLKTSWVDPNLEYERALDKFIKSILGPTSTKEGPQFVSSFDRFHEQVSYYGMLNSLSQLLMKLTCPGIPDIYQGNEMWDFSLVDPDNRRPVDFALRSKMLSSLERRIRSSKAEMDVLARDLVSKMSSGLIKMYVLHQSLKFRSEHETLFKNGTYIPLRAKGPKSEHVCAFARKTEDDECVVVVPRLFVSLLSGIKYHDATNIWKDTSLIFPKGVATTSADAYSNIFTGRKVVVVKDQKGNATLQLSDVLNEFPVGLIAS